MLLYCDQPHNSWIEQIYTPFFNSPHNSQHFFDIYSLCHIFSYLLVGSICKNIFGYNKIVITILAFSGLVFEMIENSGTEVKKYSEIEKESRGFSGYRGDSAINVIGDVLSDLFGLYLAYNLSNQATIGVLLALFVVMTYFLGFSYLTDFAKFIFPSK